MFDRPPQLLPVQLRNFLSSWTGGEASSQSTAPATYTTQQSVPHYRSFGPMGPYGGSVMPIVMTEPQSPLFAATHQTPSSAYRNSLSPLHCISTTPVSIPPPLAQILQNSNGGNASPVPASALVQQQFSAMPPHSPSHHDHHHRHHDEIHVRQSPLLGEGLPTFTPTLKLPHSTPWR